MCCCCCCTSRWRTGRFWCCCCSLCSCFCCITHADPRLLLYVAAVVSGVSWGFYACVFILSLLLLYFLLLVQLGVPSAAERLSMLHKMLSQTPHCLTEADIQEVRLLLLTASVSPSSSFSFCVCLFLCLSLSLALALLLFSS